jgi:uracil-DNA glycosylase family 4
MQSEAGSQVRAWVDYFRDLGIYDFYRRDEPADVLLQEGEAVTLMESASPRVEDGAAVSVTIAASAEPYSEVALSGQQPSVSTTVPANKLISFNDLAPLPAASIPAGERAAALLAIQEEIGDCTRCPLAYAGRRTIVFGDGSPSARLMFVGEGPGADEDEQGVPFVGKAGQLLNNMITAMGLARADVYIANIVKCRPPGNRVPEPVEANTCTQFLARQIDVVQPEVIVALGATAATYLLGVKQSLSGLRGRWHTCRGAKLVVTYHPAFLLRDPRQKAEAWKDLQMVMAELGLHAPERK